MHSLTQTENQFMVLNAESSYFEALKEDRKQERRKRKQEARSSIKLNINFKKSNVCSCVNTKLDIHSIQQMKSFALGCYAFNLEHLGTTGC